MSRLDIKVVALDLDGTLLDTLPDLAGAANAMREALDMPPLPRERIRFHIGDGMASLVGRVLTDDLHAAPAADLFERALPLFQRLYLERIAAESKPYPQVLDGLAAMRAAGLQLAVVTNKATRFTLPLLAATGLESWFSLVVCGDTLPEKKPHPQPVLHTAAHFAVAPAQLLMIGDSYNDIAAARAAGAPVFAVPYGYARDGDVAALGADRIVAGLVEALEFIDNA